MTKMLKNTWARIRTVLDARAPLTARTIRAAALIDDIAAAQSVMVQTFPDALRDQLLIFNGVEPNPVTGVLLPPLYLPVGLDRMQMLWQRGRANAVTSTEGECAGSVAGEPCQVFHPLLIPVGDDTTGDLLVVDNRPGELRGSVLVWSQADGSFGTPTWRSVTEMWTDVAGALETGFTQGTEDGGDPDLTRNGCAASFTAAGTLEWEF